jgi:hypothetical protein
MKKCALDTRVSTSMQAEKDYGSCEAQRDKILSYVKSQEDLPCAPRIKRTAERHCPKEDRKFVALVRYCKMVCPARVELATF